MSNGFAHTCAVRTDGVIECWGETYAIYGGGWVTCSLNGCDIGGPSKFVQVITNSFNTTTCGLRVDGSVQCWGVSQEVRGSRTASSGQFVQVSTGSYGGIVGVHACGLRTDGIVECWGNKTLGQAPATGVTTHLGRHHRYDYLRTERTNQSGDFLRGRAALSVPSATRGIPTFVVIVTTGSLCSCLKRVWLARSKASLRIIAIAGLAPGATLSPTDLTERRCTCFQPPVPDGRNGVQWSKPRVSIHSDGRRSARDLYVLHLRPQTAAASARSSCCAPFFTTATLRIKKGEVQLGGGD